MLCNFIHKSLCPLLVLFALGTTAQAQRPGTVQQILSGSTQLRPGGQTQPQFDEAEWMMASQASHDANPDVFMKSSLLTDFKTRDSLAITLHQLGVSTNMRAWGFTKVDMFHRRVGPADTRGFIAYSDDTVLVAFCGSEYWDGAIDWWGTDAAIDKVPGGFVGVTGNVHLGFSFAADIVYRDIFRQLSRNADGRRVVVTGHSLGGALATLTAQRLVNDGIDVAALYAFANPAVGDREFTDGFIDSGVTCVRTYNHRDPVPEFLSIIETIRGLGSDASSYAHVDSLEIYFSPSGQALFDPILFPWRLGDELPSLSEHDPFIYLLLTYWNLSPETREIVPEPVFESASTR